ncbi:MAG: thiamine phosphate synthase [Pseudomonadota bacterium]
MTEHPQICLQLPQEAPGVTALRDVLDAVAIASARMPAGATAAQLIAVLQDAGAAALIEDDARAALELGADGVHVARGDLDAPDTLARFAAARDVLGADRIAGAESGATRHAAMELGEAGADYVGFALPNEAGDAMDAWRAQVRWWADVFEVPCVALGCRSEDHVCAAVAAGADFVELVWPERSSETEAGRHVRQLAQLVVEMRDGAGGDR